MTRHISFAYCLKCCDYIMPRKVGKQILCLLTTILALFLVSYLNFVINLQIRDSSNGSSTISSLIQATPVPAVATIHLDKSNWKVLWDGTVIHNGNGIIHRNYTFLINHHDKCKDLKNTSISFLVVVVSNIVNFDERQQIRDTWGLSLLQEIGNFKVVFLLGTINDTEVQNKVNFENLIYEDIVQINIKESFMNLTYKSINMLYWYITFCKNADFLYKIDDDIYLHIPNLIQMFHNVSKSDTIICHQNKSKKILRSFADSRNYLYSIQNGSLEMLKQLKQKFNKYIIEFQQLPGVYYPDYCSGFSYTMNLDVAQKLFETSITIPYIGIEDVFITGFCRQKCNVTITNNIMFRLKPFLHPIEGKCAFDKGRITSNEMVVDDIRKLWTHVNTQGYYCKFT